MRGFFRNLIEAVRPHPMLPLWRRWLQWIAVGIGACFVTGFTLFILTLLIFSQGLPDISKESSRLQAQSTQILDREGNILYAVHGEENRDIVGIEAISPYLLDATIAVEDNEFFEHNGFDIPCYAKAITYEVFGVGIRRGCSTITQQLVKNLFLTPEQTYSRKIQELILAVRMERKFDKNQILGLYLNEIPYGNNAYGAELAARTYFDKPASELDLVESAIMASLPKAPTRYSPYGNNRYSHLLTEFSEEQLQGRTITKENDLKIEEYTRGLIGANIELANGSTLYIPGRVDIALGQMLSRDMITESEYQEAIAASNDIEFKPYRENIKYPHFVLYVKELVEEKYGKEVVEQGGLKIYTTIDPNFQDIAEEAIAKYKERNATQFKASNASLVAVSPQTGQILAMVGSADYFDEEIDGNVNIATRYRQPGSSFKPFVYALAFLNGYAPATVLYDVETQFGPGQYPQNYDGQFVGPIAIRSALALSRNIPAIKAYFLASQEEKIIPFMRKFGIELDDTIGYGWPLALGSGEVRLIDMVEAYGVFANNGVRKPLSPILKIENRDNEILEKWEDTPGTEVLDPQVAYLITDILSDPTINLGPRVRVENYHVAAKTGTSNKKSDRGDNIPNNGWVMGYTTKLVAGVWTGNADNTPMSYTANGYDVAGPIWNDFMKGALTQLSDEAFPVPAGITQVAVSMDSGLLPSEKTPADRITTEKFATFNIPTKVEEDRYVTLKVDKFTGLIANDYSPPWAVEEKDYIIHKAVIPEYTYWQAGIDAWVKKTEGLEVPPDEVDNVHTPELFANQPHIVITSPGNFSAVPTGRTTIEAEATAPNGFNRVEFHLNNQLQFTDVSAPYSGNVRIPPNAKPGQIFTVNAYAYDDYGYRGESSIELKILE